MTEKMKSFMEKYGIDIPVEIEGNPYEGLSTSEVDKAKEIETSSH